MARPAATTSAWAPADSAKSRHASARRASPIARSASSRARASATNGDSGGGFGRWSVAFATAASIPLGRAIGSSHESGGAEIETLRTDDHVLPNTEGSRVPVTTIPEPSSETAAESTVPTRSPFSMVIGAPPGGTVTSQSLANRNARSAGNWDFTISGPPPHQQFGGRQSLIVHDLTVPSPTSAGPLQPSGRRM